MESKVNLADHLKAQETSLLTSITRKNPEAISALLADNFQEFGSSGRVYSKQEIVAALQQESPVTLSLLNFKVTFLTPGVAHATYRSLKEEHSRPPTMALRSSIWVQEGDQWRMLFHQGTKITAAADSLQLPS